MLTPNSKSRLRALAASCVLAVSLWGGAGTAEAGLFQVTPVRLPLSASVKSGILTIKNQNAEPMRVQATAFAWSQGSDGSTLLSPSTDLVFFPSLLSLAPGESRNIRVGSTTAAGSVEKTYRVIVEELPPPRRPGDANAVRVLVRMSIPVFIQPATPRPHPRLEVSRFDALRLTFALTNRGSSHFMTRKVEVLGLDDSGERVFTESLPAWYVLAGGSRDYALELPKAACTTARIEVRAETDQKVVSFPLTRPSCTP